MVWGDFNTEELTQNAQADCQNPSLWWNHLRRQTVQSFDHPCSQGYWKKGKKKPRWIFQCLFNVPFSLRDIDQNRCSVNGGMTETQKFATKRKLKMSAFQFF